MPDFLSDAVREGRTNMAITDGAKSRHFVLDNVTETEGYRFPGAGRTTRPGVPRRKRKRHASSLQRQLDAVREGNANAVKAQRDTGMKEGLGLSVEFESFPQVELLFKGLARDAQGIELLNVRHSDGVTRATVFVPDGKLDHFEKRIEDYRKRRFYRDGRRGDHRDLINAINVIRMAGLEALWTDDPNLIPSVEEGPVWWEVWLPVRNDRNAVTAAFRGRAEMHGMYLAAGELPFPERTVLLARASVEQMRASMVTLNTIAELRKPNETADFFDSMAPGEQREWLGELLDRTGFPRHADKVPYVCLLDTGVNRGHRLLAPALGEADLHAVMPGWGIDDSNGHGTAMAGLALGGNLTDLLAGSFPVRIGHRLESVKLLREGRRTGTDPGHHGHLTVQAVALPEISAPSRRRVFGMAVTARDNRDRGRPSAWSSAIDALAADWSDSRRNPRLFFVSAGNVDDFAAWRDYPNSNDSDGVHDPAQAWNVLTVGAYTDLVSTGDSDPPDLEPVAPKGGLSPFSTTSLPWEEHLPMKPDIVMEGGNVARDAAGFVAKNPSLSLLTTAHRPRERSFTTIDATSAATALACRLGAQVMAEYPNLWPETIRGLIVHSAEWTEAMKNTYLPLQPTKSHHRQLLRRCGFGVPSRERALWSVANSLTMVVQQRMFPFERSESGNIVTRDMQIHRLPWPRDVLEDLGGVPVEMRVTLSYFVEPNPSRRGMRSRYRYESHGFRFDVKRPHEDVRRFRNRINAATRDHEYTRDRTGSDSSWIIGTQGRHNGSIHGDIWKGSAVELAGRGAIAIYPTTGWWKTRQALKRYNDAARYSLIVNIRAPETDVDLYAEVANRIQIEQPTEIAG